MELIVDNGLVAIYYAIIPNEITHMRIDDFLSQYAKPEAKITQEEIIKEVNEAYAGHLQAEAEKYCCDVVALDNVLGGAGRFRETAIEFFEYAVDGLLNTTDSGIQDSNWLDFSSFINQARWDAEFHNANSLAPGLEKLLKQSAVRARLDLDTLGEAASKALPTIFQDDNCGYLSLVEVAFLAQMNEKSVRNATQPNAPDRLQTYKKGARTVVDSDEALRWLKGRRNFKPTVLV